MKKIISLLLVLVMFPIIGVYADNDLMLCENELIDFYKNGGPNNSQAYIYMGGDHCFLSSLHNDTSPLGGASAKFDFTDYLSQAQINSTKPYDITDIYDSAYLKFYIYIETESNENHGLSVCLSDRKYNHTGSVYLPFELENNKWQEITVKLSDFEKNDMDLTDMYRVAFEKAVKTTENYLIFVQGVRFVKPWISEFKCEPAADGTINLSWQAVSGAEYNVLRDGIKIAEGLTSANYDDFSPEYGKMHTYTVEAVKGGKKYLTDEVKAEARIAALENDFVVVRVGSGEAYINGIRKNIDDFDSSVAPFMKNGTVYLPTELCGAENTEETVLYNGISFASAENIASSLGKTAYIKDSVAVITSQKSVPNGFFEKYNDKLEYYWDNAKLGPYGYVTGMVIHPKNSSIKYARTDVGGIYRYDNEHRSWKWLSEDLNYDDNALRCVKSVAIDANNENVIYAAGGESGNCALIKSEDKGETWRKLNFKGSLEAENHLRLSGESIAVDPNNSSVVYCGTNKEGLWVSTNGGESFANVIGGENVTVVAADEASGTVNGRTKVVYAGVYGKGVYKSTDGGVTFSAISGGPLKPYRFQVMDGILYASGDRTASGDAYNAGLFRYTGSAWEDITPSMRGGINTVGGFAVSKSNPNLIIAQGMPYRENNMYRSTDGGKTWQNMNEVCYGGCQILFDPDNENGVYVPHGAGLSYIADVTAKKLTAESFDKGIEEICVNEVVSGASENAPELFTSCMDKGLMVSESAEEYAFQATPYTYTGTGVDYCAKAPQYMIKSGWLGFPNTWNLKGNLCVSSDYGRTWTKTAWSERDLVLDCTIGAELQQNGYPILMITAKTAEGDDVYRSLDFGQTWEKLGGASVSFNDNAWNALNQYLSADKEDGNVFYLSCSGSFSSTTDGGLNWNTVSLPVGYNVITKTMPGVRGEVWTICGDGLYKSADCGRSFEKLTTVKKCHAFDFGKGRGNVPALYVKGIIDGVFGMFVSEDLGETFRLISHTTEAAFPTADISGSLLDFGKVYMGTSGRGTVYAQSVYNREADAPKLTAEQKRSNEVCITWEYHGAYDYARVLCGGNEIAKVSGPGYSYIPSELKKNYTYSVELCDKNGNVLAVSDEKGVYAEDYFLTEAVSIFENKSNCYTGNGVSLASDTASPLGGKSICLSYPSGYTWEERTIQHDAIYDISSFAKSGYLSFWAYVDGECSEYKLGIELWNASWHRISLEGYTLDTSSAASGWKKFLIPLSELVTASGSELNNLKQIKFIKKSTTSNETKLYLQDIAILSHENEFGAASFLVSGADGTYKITAEAVNAENEENRVYIAAAAFSGDTLVDTKLFSDVVLGNNTAELNFTYTVSEDVKYDNIKVFLLNKSFVPIKSARKR